MKTILKLCLTMILACGFAACGKKNGGTGVNASEVIGKYKLVEMIDQNGTDITDDIKLLETHGMIVTITLGEDGTGQFDMFGELTDVTWTERSISMNGEEITLAYANNVMTLTNVAGEPSTMIFNRITE